MANKNTNKNIGTNYVTVTGRVESDFEFSHKSGNKSFYMTKIAVKRLSDVEDHIQLIVPETLIDTAEDYVGKCVRVRGNYRSYNNRGEQKNRVLLAVFAKEITFTDEEPDARKSNRFRTGRRKQRRLRVRRTHRFRESGRAADRQRERDLHDRQGRILGRLQLGRQRQLHAPPLHRRGSEHVHQYRPQCPNGDQPALSRHSGRQLRRGRSRQL